MTSEEELTALERSKDDPSILLDRAIAIAAIQIDQQTGRYFKKAKLVSGHRPSDFREQWLLKWLLKRFKEASAASSDNSNGDDRAGPVLNYSMLGDLRAWALLLYLLEIIANQTVLDILLERGFVSILVASQRHMTHEPGTSALPQISEAAISTSIDERREQPRKRRRLDFDSESSVGTKDFATSRDQLLLAIINYFVCLLQDRPLSIQITPRNVTPAWTTSSEEAARFVGLVLRVAHQALGAADSKVRSSANSAIEKWLDLWHSFSMASSAKDKRMVHKHFNECCLNKLLDILGDIQLNPDSGHFQSVKAAIERQIALHTIMPVRTQFNDKLSKAWKDSKEVVAWDDVQPLYDCLIDHLGDALVDESIPGAKFISFQHSEYSGQLLSIASRLIPREDLRRRQWERPWLEALTLALCHLAFAQEMPRLSKNKDAVLYTEDQRLPIGLHADRDIKWPTNVLDVLQHQHIFLSTPASSYLITAVLSWPESQTPVRIVSKLVRLDVDCFIQQPGVANAEQCFDRLTTIIEGKQLLSQAEFHEVTNEIVLPFMRGFSRSRGLVAYVELWLGLLENAFRTRKQASGFESVLVWDDEDVFDEFEMLCRNDTVSSFGREFYDEAVQKVSEIVRLIGSTAANFAMVAILNCLIRAKSSSALLLGMNSDLLGRLAAAVFSALRQKNDYQGQRWRLWSLLQSLVRAYPQLAVENDFIELVSQHMPKPLSHQSSEHLQKQQTLLNEEPSYLMEIIQSFALFLELYRVVPSNLHQDLQTRILDVRDLTNLVQAQKVGVTGAPGHIMDLSWDGRLSTLRSRDELLCAYYGLILQKFEHLPLDTLSPLSKWLRKLAYQSLKTTRTLAETSSLGYLAQRIVQSQDEVQGRSTFCDYVELLMEDTDLTVPSLLQSLPLKDVDKVWAGKAAEKLYARTIRAFKDSHTTAPENSVAHLCLLTKLVTGFAVSVGIPENSNQLLALIRAIQLSRTDFIFPVVVRCVHTIFLTCYRRAAEGGKQGAIRTLLNAFRGPGATPLEQELVSSVNGLNSNDTEATDLPFPNFSMDGGDSDSKQSIQTRITNLMTLSKSEYTLGSTQRILNAALDLARELDTKQKSETLLQLNTSSKTSTNPNYVLISAAIMATLDEQEIALLPDAFDILAETVCLANILESSDALHVLFMCDSCDLLLKHLPGIVNQATIDSLLANICALATSSELHLSPTAVEQGTAVAIYDRLLSLLTTLLTRYRRRLSGRTHLLLLVLQNLLKSLYYTPEKTYIHQNPATTKQKQAFRNSLPSWLGLEAGKPLPPTSAEKFSRILSSICNPTTASARSAHRGRKQDKNIQTLELNDETQKAKRIAAQYMQYFIMEYARCTLDGVILPAAKDKLLPGLYSVLDALDRDMMRAMNAAMDPSSRAIFKGLYDDWMNFGKWNQS